jgi:hypothetical protein
MSQAASTATSGNVTFGRDTTSPLSLPIVAVVVAALLLAFIVFRKTK